METFINPVDNFLDTSLFSRMADYFCRVFSLYQEVSIFYRQFQFLRKYNGRFLGPLIGAGDDDLGPASFLWESFSGCQCLRPAFVRQTSFRPLPEPLGVRFCLPVSDKIY